jgi:hypothetical protein
MKKCKICLVEKELTEFFNDKRGFQGKKSKCKACMTLETYAWRDKHRDQYNNHAKAFRKRRDPETAYGYEIKRRYGCTLEQYNEMLVKQEGKCALCQRLHNPAEKKGRLYVDHCHKSGKVRQLLCGACNSALGYFKDDTRVMAEAIAYIIRHRG